MVSEEQSETIKGREEEKQKEVSEESKTEAAGISILRLVKNVEIHSDKEMQPTVVNKVHETRNVRM